MSNRVYLAAFLGVVTAGVSSTGWAMDPEELARVQKVMAVAQLTQETSVSGYTFNTPASTCAPCHAEEYDAWYSGESGDFYPTEVYTGGYITATPHRLAFLDSTFHLHYMENDSPEVCLRCHVPASVYTTYNWKLVKAPETRSLNSPNALEGITCVTCHLDESGTIRGEHDYGLEVADHVVVSDDEMFDGSTMCGSCHESIVYGALNSTYQQWEQQAKGSGITCVDCHMSDLSDFEEEAHNFPGAHSYSMLEWGLDVTWPTNITATSDFSVKACNYSAGHNVPSGDQFRAYVFHVEITGNGVNYSHDKYISPKFITPYMREIVDYDRYEPVPFNDCRNMPYDDANLSAGSYTVKYELGFWLLKPTQIKRFADPGTISNPGEVYTKVDAGTYTLTVR